jgi:maltooligosyltrehalose trehalohydrolase
VVRKGREEFLRQFASIAAEQHLDDLSDPGDPATFERSRLDWAERERNEAHLALHEDLITLRRRDPVLSGDTREIDGAVLGPQAFVLRFFSKNGGDRLLVVNLGPDLHLAIVPEPLLAPPDRERGWDRVWHSEDARYGARGAPALELSEKGNAGTWRIPAESATLLASSA